ncbi:MAG: membrane protein insertase YidC, partial [Methylocella sp.]
MTQETRNIVVATCLSLLVVLGWDAFYARPRLDKERQTQAEMHTRATSDAKPGPRAGNSQATRSQAPTSAAPGLAEPSPPQKSRADALADSPRVKLDAPAIYGSIALKGGRIDDVSLKSYRETVDPNSPNIVLLSPAGSPSPYYADVGFIADPGASLVLPGPDTLWQADHDTLTETSPVTLTYDNGQGLVFHRKIAVDDRYMLTVTDSVENKSTQAVTLHPYAFVKRHGWPVAVGSYLV